MPSHLPAPERLGKCRAVHERVHGTPCRTGYPPVSTPARIALLVLSCPVSCIDVEPVWADGLTGVGVQIVVNDDGLDLTSAEFADAFDAAGSCIGSDVGVVGCEACGDLTHGTACAAIALVPNLAAWVQRGGATSGKAVWSYSGDAQAALVYVLLLLIAHAWREASGAESCTTPTPARGSLAPTCLLFTRWRFTSTYPHGVTVHTAC